MDERLHDILGLEPRRSPARAHERAAPDLWFDELLKSVRESVRVARRDKFCMIAHQPTLRWGVRGNDDAAGREPLIDLVGNDAKRLGPGTEDAKTHVVARDQLGQRVRFHPRLPGDMRMLVKLAVDGGGVLPRTDQRRFEPNVPLEKELERLSDHSRALKRSEEPEEHHPQYWRRFRADGMRGVEPRCPRPDGYHHAALRIGEHLPMFLRVHDGDVGATERCPVEGLQCSHPQAARTTITRSVTSEEQMVEDNRGPAEEQSGNEDVEVPHVPDQHDLGIPVSPEPSRTDDQLPPTAQESKTEVHKSPRLLQHADSLSRREAQRVVQLLHLVSLGTQPIEDDAESGMLSRVIGPECEVHELSCQRTTRSSALVRSADPTGVGR